MQVEAHREVVAAPGRQALAMRRREHVLAVEPPAVGREPERALVHHAEAARIAVVGEAQRHAVVALLTRHLHVGGTGQDRRAEQGPQQFGGEEAARGGVIEDHGRMRGARARHMAPGLAARCRQAAIDHDAVIFRGQLERQAAGVRLVAQRQRRRRSGIDDQQGIADLHALIAGVRRIRDRRAARIVVGEHGRDQIGAGRPHAVEQREVAVAVAEEAQHRHHAVDRIVQRRPAAARCAPRRPGAAAADRAATRSARPDCGSHGRRRAAPDARARR